MLIRPLQPAVCWMVCPVKCAVHDTVKAFASVDVATNTHQENRKTASRRSSQTCEPLFGCVSDSSSHRGRDSSHRTDNDSSDDDMGNSLHRPCDIRKDSKARNPNNTDRRSSSHRRSTAH